jgi:hypothetical protein
MTTEASSNLLSIRSGSKDVRISVITGNVRDDRLQDIKNIDTNSNVKSQFDYTYQVTVPSGADKTLTYDLNGNMLGDGTRNYQWDAANRLVAIWYGTVGSSARTTMNYDGLSRRVGIVEKDATGTVTSTKQFVWDGMSIAEERNAGNTVTKRFYGQGEKIGAASYYYAKDHLGSIL